MAEAGTCAKARRAVLIVDHGSRHEPANDLIGLVADRLREQQPGWLVAHAHMEMAPPSLADAVATCVAQGAEEIVVVPYFLGAGRHTRETIPELVEEASRAHADVTIRISAHLGLHDKLVEVVVERVAEVEG